MTKLTKAQQEVLDKAKAQIDEARKYDSAEAYYEATHNGKAFDGNVNFIENWKLNVEGWAWVRGSVATKRKLAQLGLIEFKDREAVNRCFDDIKVLNY